jgi:RNA polymerase sigma-70 factor (ECF subfamily)
MRALTDRSRAIAWSRERRTHEEEQGEEAPDSELVRLARRGEVAASQELIRRYQDRIYTVAFSYVQDPDEAVDITQDTLLRMLAGLSRFQERSNFSTWLHRIAVNRCIDWHRRRERRPPPTSLEEMAAAGAELPDTRRALQPHEALESKELREQIRAAIAAVPALYRTVVLLADVQGLSMAEIAQIVRCPTNTVKTRLHRGRLIIRERLRDYLRNEEYDLS